MPKFTNIEQKILDVLSDGKRHKKYELQKCRGPSSINGLTVTISYLRKKLLEIGQDIVSVNTGTEGYAYQHVRLLNPNDE